MVFPNTGVSCKFSFKPIQWNSSFFTNPISKNSKTWVSMQCLQRTAETPRSAKVSWDLPWISAEKIIKKNRFNPANHQPPCFQKLQTKPGLWMTSWYLTGPQRFNGHFRNLNLHNCQYHIKSLNRGIFPQHMALYNYMVQYLHLGSGQSPTTGRLLINAHLRVDTCRWYDTFTPIQMVSG